MIPYRYGNLNQVHRQDSVAIRLLRHYLYRRPKILVMDEATSHLDISSEREVSGLVQQLEMTRIIVAHRPQTISSADRVLVLHNGSLHEIPKENDGSTANINIAANEHARVEVEQEQSEAT